MNHFKFNCSHCGRRLKVEVRVCGGQVRCPACQNITDVPRPPATSTAGEPECRPPSEGLADPQQQTLDAQQARTAVFWRRKEPPTSSQTPGGLGNVGEN